MISISNKRAQGSDNKRESKWAPGRPLSPTEMLACTYVCVSVSSHITTCTVKLCDWLSKLYAAISITKQRVKCPIVMIIGEVQRFLSVLIVLQTELVMETVSFGSAARRWIYCVDFSNSPHHIPTLLVFFFFFLLPSLPVCVCVFSLTLASRLPLPGAAAAVRVSRHAKCGRCGVVW